MLFLDAIPVPQTQAQPDFSVSQIITSIISGLAFSLSLYSLYLQRKDKKAVLKLELVLTRLPIKTNGGFDYCLVIAARNPTEKAITIKQVSFIQGKKSAVEVKIANTKKVVESGSLFEIVIRLEELVKAFGSNSAKGYFVIEDVLGNKFKTKKSVTDLAKIESYFKSPQIYTNYISKFPERKDEIKNRLEKIPLEN